MQCMFPSTASDQSYVIDHVDWAVYCTADVYLSVAERVGINIDRCTEITIMPDIELTRHSMVECLWLCLIY